MRVRTKITNLNLILIGLAISVILALGVIMSIKRQSVGQKNIAMNYCVLLLLNRSEKDILFAASCSSQLPLSMIPLLQLAAFQAPTNYLDNY